jgi:hypothetical protein
MNCSRRASLFSLLTLPIASAAQKPEPPIIHLPPPLPTGDSHGKSKEEIAEENREEAMRDADDLVRVSQELRDELKKAGSYVVSVPSVKKTKEIEKLARRIRGRLKAG